MKPLALAIAAASSLVLFTPSSEARPFGRGHGVTGHHHGFHGHRGASLRHHHRGYHGYRGVGFRSSRYGYRRHYGRYGYRRSIRGLGLAAGLGLGLAASAIQPAYYGASYGYGHPYAPVDYGYGYTAGRPYCSCAY